MKNKFLLSVFATAIAAFAFTSCEPKSNVTEVCTDMLKESLHKSARSLEQLDGQTLKISEYEFLGGVNDNRLVYRTIAFGNGTNEPKKVDTLTYAYGEWIDQNTAFTLLVTPPTGDPYTLLYQGNALITPDKRAIGGEGTANSARVEKWEKTIASLPNSDWEALYEGEFVVDSILEDSVYVNPITFEQITIKVFKGKMDTLSADTTYYCRFEINRDANNANTGHYYVRTERSKYNRATKEKTIISEKEKDFDCTWYFAEVSSGAKFTLVLQSTDGDDVEKLSISKYKTDDSDIPVEFQLGGLMYARPAKP